MVTQYARVESSRVESSRVVPSALCVFFSDPLRSPALSLSLLQSALKLFSHNSDFSKWKYPRQKYPGNIQEISRKRDRDRFSIARQCICPSKEKFGVRFYTGNQQRGTGRRRRAAPFSLPVFEKKKKEEEEKEEENFSKRKRRRDLERERARDRDAAEAVRSREKQELSGKG